MFGSVPGEICQKVDIQKLSRSFESLIGFEEACEVGVIWISGDLL